MGMILRIASSRIVGQGDIVGRSGYFSLNLSANSVMRGRLDARRTLKSLVADLRFFKNDCKNEITQNCDSILSLESSTESPYYIWAKFYQSYADDKLVPQTIQILRKKLSSLDETDPWYPHFTFALSYLLIKIHSDERIKK